MENVTSEGNPQLHAQAAVDGWIPLGCLSFRECVFVFPPKKWWVKISVAKRASGIIERDETQISTFLKICNVAFQIMELSRAHSR